MITVRHQLTDNPVPPISSPGTLIPVDPPYSPVSHRDQDKVDPISAFKMKISKDEDGDRQSLVAKTGSDDDDLSYSYTRDYLEDNDDDTAGFSQTRRGL